MIDVEGKEQIKTMALAYLMRARKVGGNISIKSDDPKYLMNILYEVRREHGYDDIAIQVPDREGEIWLIKRTSPSLR